MQEKRREDDNAPMVKQSDEESCNVGDFVLLPLIESLFY
jgi:hypothetical protein